MKDGTYLEIGGGSIHDNTFNLLLNGWKGYAINSGHYFMYTKADIEVMNYWVTPKNLNEIFQKHSVPRELDLLSIDIDSYDLKLWEALSEDYQPRVVVIEMNSGFPLETKATITGMDENWSWDNYSKSYGSSFGAILDCATRKGYTYVYHMTFTDMFFIRNDLVTEELRNIDPRDTYDMYPIHNPTQDNKYDFMFMD